MILNLIIPDEAMEVLPTKAVEEAEEEKGQEEPVVATATAAPVAEKAI